MVESSFPWGGTSTGDATQAPYDDDEWSDIWSFFFQYDRTTEGIIPSGRSGYVGNLEVTKVDNNTVRVGTGIAIVDGKQYRNNANIDIDVSDTGNGYYRIVLRKNFSAQTVRAVDLYNAGSIPNVTQTDGTTWEISLATFTRSAGVIGTITDTRKFASGLIPGKKLIEEIILTSDATITFSNIPQIYKHLTILYTARVTAYGVATFTSGLALFNGDNDADHYHFGLMSVAYDDVTPDTYQYSAPGAIQGLRLGTFPPGDSSDYHFGSGEITIYDYSRSDRYKMVAERGDTPSVSSGVLDMLGLHIRTGQYISTDAITSIFLQSSRNDTSGNYYFESGSIFRLYGSFE